MPKITQTALSDCSYPESTAYNIRDEIDDTITRLKVLIDEEASLRETSRTLFVNNTITKLKDVIDEEASLHKTLRTLFVKRRWEAIEQVRVANLHLHLVNEEEAAFCADLKQATAIANEGLKGPVGSASVMARIEEKRLAEENGLEEEVAQETAMIATVEAPNTPQRTESRAPAAGKIKRKLDVNSLFQKAQQPSSTPTSAPAPTPTAPVPVPALPAGNRSSFIAKRPILIKNSAGEMIDLADLAKKAPPKQEDSSAPSRKEEAERRPVSIRLETVDAHKKRIEEEKLKGKDRFNQVEEKGLSEIEAKPQPLPSALASARIIEDIRKVSYPEGIKVPSSELNVNASSGKFLYDRDFLMQFMKVCKERPDDMPSLDTIGLEPSEQQSVAGRRGRRGKKELRAIQ